MMEKQIAHCHTPKADLVQDWVTKHSRAQRNRNVGCASFVAKVLPSFEVALDIKNIVSFASLWVIRNQEDTEKCQMAEGICKHLSL